MKQAESWKLLVKWNLVLHLVLVRHYVGTSTSSIVPKYNLDLTFSIW